MDKVISEWSKEYQLKSYGGCLCGSYICNLDELGCLGLEVRCRKSNSCPTGQDWIIEDSIVLFNQNLVGEDNCILNECDFEDMSKELKQIRILDSYQSDILRDTARNSFIIDGKEMTQIECINKMISNWKQIIVPTEKLLLSDDKIYNLKKETILIWSECFNCMWW